MIKLLAAKLYGDKKQIDMGVSFWSENGDFNIRLDNHEDCKPFACSFLSRNDIENLIKYLIECLEADKK